MNAKDMESMVLSREKRRNAGARMAELLNKEDCDEFYQSTYGGFFDEEGDDAYQSPAESESDYVDSDFDIEEDKPAEDNDDDDDDYNDESEKRKKSTKAYKEPTYRQKSATSTSKAEIEQKPKSSSGPQQETVSVVSKRERREISPAPGKKLRQSTVLKAEEHERRREERMEKKRRRKKYQRSADYYEKPTQAELLRETKETEELNLKSLERFQQYELEKRKRHRLSKQRLIKGPSIRYVSLTMPSALRSGGNSTASLARSDSNFAASTTQSQTPTDRDRGRHFSRFYLGDEQSNSGSRTNSGRSSPTASMEPPSHSENDVFITGSQQTAKKASNESNMGKCARTFITFSDDATFDRLVPNSRKRLTIPKPQYCVVTALPAKYLDPLTKLPYANAEAFKIIREAYYKYVDEKGDKNDPAVAAWLQSRRA